MAVIMKPRPKVGDRVEFRYRGLKIGEIIAVAVTGVHFLIKYPSSKYKYTRRLIGINKIIRILPEVDFKLTPVECKPEQCMS